MWRQRRRGEAWRYGLRATVRFIHVEMKPADGKLDVVGVNALQKGFVNLYRTFATAIHMASWAKRLCHRSSSESWGLTFLWSWETLVALDIAVALLKDNIPASCRSSAIQCDS